MPKPDPLERVSISLPASLLRDVDRLRRKTGESRGAVVRRSIELLLRSTQHDETVRTYVEGYLAHPERRSEVDAAMASAAEALAAEGAFGRRHRV